MWPFLSELLSGSTISNGKWSVDIAVDKLHLKLFLVQC